MPNHECAVAVHHDGRLTAGGEEVCEWSAVGGTADRSVELGVRHGRLAWLGRHGHLPRRCHIELTSVSPSDAGAMSTDTWAG